MATLRREIPEAKVSRRYRILLDGLAVRLPAEKLQRLMQLGFVKDVYPSVGYTLAMNRAPVDHRRPGACARRPAWEAEASRSAWSTTASTRGIRSSIPPA